jgi:hypothetical protein
MAHESGSCLDGADGADRAELSARIALLAELESAVGRLLAAAANPSADVPVGDTWTVRDVVGHVTFYVPDHVNRAVEIRWPSPGRTLTAGPW